MRRRGHGAGVVAIVGTAALLGSCLNAGQDRVLAIQATGIIKGLVYFDRDGNGVPDAADTALSGVTVRLIVSGTQDTVARAVSDTGGLLRFDGVPIGTIVVAVDSTTIPTDSLRITRIDVSTVKVTPGDSFAVRVAVSFPQLDVTNARTYALGKKVFVVGVALNNVSAFGDSTVHLADTTAAILLTGVRPLVAAGDSVRVLGTRRTRSGQPTLANPTIVGLSVGAATPSHQVTTALAAQADSGRIDAALASIVGATVQDTATVAGNRRLTVTDGSGPLTMQLDTIAGFRGAALALDTLGATLDAVGVLVPSGVGTWLLLPRARADVVVR